MPKEYGAQPGTPTTWGPPPLTARPEGLLASLGIQSGGQYPQHLLPDLQPTYELGDWYREFNQAFTTSGSVNLAGVGTPTEIDLISVPAGEVWIVNRIGCQITIRAASVLYMTYQLIRTNNANGTQLAVSRPVEVITPAGAIDGRAYLGLDYPPLLLRPTVKLRLLVGQTRTGSAAVPTVGSAECFVAFTRCQVGSPT